MIRVTATITMVSLLAAASVAAQSLVITRGGTRPVRPAPPQNFTGTAHVEMLFEAVDPSHASAGMVTFEPGARTAWHTHPRGQILIITAGVGRVQRWGDPVEEVRTGDVVRIPAGQKHWHGGSPQTSMTHVAISEHRDGTTVQWMEQVSDEQYNAVPPTDGRRDADSTSHQTVSASQTTSPAASPGPRRPSGPVQQRVAPGMAALTDDVLYADVWRRPELSARDRGLVTITALIAVGKTAPLAGHLGRALDNGLRPIEASGLLAHLAIYCGWPSAVAALEAYDQVYTARRVDTESLRSAGAQLPVPASESARAQEATRALAAAPKFLQLTNDVVFGDLWRRAELSLRDRSLATIVALSAMGDGDELEFYVKQGLESGLTRAQITEAITHLAFYAGWTKATKAMTTVSQSFGR